MTFFIFNVMSSYRTTMTNMTPQSRFFLGGGTHPMPWHATICVKDWVYTRILAIHSHENIYFIIHVQSNVIVYKLLNTMLCSVEFITFPLCQEINFNLTLTHPSKFLSKMSPKISNIYISSHTCRLVLKYKAIRMQNPCPKYLQR